MKTMTIKTSLVSLFSLMLISCITVQAQDAKTLLDEVTTKVKSYDNILIEFKYTLNNTREDVKQDTRGNITLQEEHYVLNMLGVTRIFNGEKIYTIVPEDEEVTISTYSNDENKGISPSKMLTFYEQGYHYHMEAIQNIKGRRIQFIKLSPKDSNAEIKDILLGIDMQSKHVYQLIQTDSSGTSYTITVNSFKTNQSISQNLFVFDEAKYKSEGYYINKLD
jgi:outer membrane lipoprotein-sorting protein